MEDGLRNGRLRHLVSFQAPGTLTSGTDQRLLACPLLEGSIIPDILAPYASRWASLAGRPLNGTEENLLQF